MNEKKLTDEEIVKGLENWILHDCTAKQEDLINALDLIHRLQAENEELKSPKFASWKIKFFNIKEEFDKELAEHEEFTKKAKAEIERLTEYAEMFERGEIGSPITMDKMLALEKDKIELQKQVDELKASREIQINELHEQHAIVAEEIKHEAVKDTAKNLLIEFNEWINGQYDAKLDTYSVHIPVHEVNDFLTDKAKEYGVEVE